MNANISKTKAAFAEEEGKLMKLLKALKKVVAKEFLWVLLLLLAAIPVAYAMVVVFESYEPLNAKLPEIDKILNGTSRYVGAYAVSIAGLYFTRMTVGAIKTLTKKKEENP